MKEVEETAHTANTGNGEEVCSRYTRRVIEYTSITLSALARGLHNQSVPAPALSSLRPDIPLTTSCNDANIHLYVEVDCR